MRCRLFGNRKFTLLITKMFIGLREMQCDRIVNSRSNTNLGQLLLEVGTVLNLYNIEMIDRACPAGLVMQRVGEGSLVVCEN